MFAARESVVTIALLFCLGSQPATKSSPAYFADFHDASLGKLPEDLMVLNGDFTIAEVHGKKSLLLPGEPLDTFGLLFGPGNFRTGDVSAVITAQAVGKRFAEFGVGSNDAGGFKLWLLPGQGHLELRQGDETKAAGRYAWTSGSATHLRLHIESQNDHAWLVQGKVWTEGSAEPGEWIISTTTAEPPSPGRASVWGIPYSGKPIVFNDLTVLQP